MGYVSFSEGINWGFTYNDFKLLSPKIASFLRKSVDLNKEIVPLFWLVGGLASQPPKGGIGWVSYAELIAGLFSGYQLRWQVA